MKVALSRKSKHEPEDTDPEYFERMRVAASPDADRIIPLAVWRQKMTQTDLER